MTTSMHLNDRIENWIDDFLSTGVKLRDDIHVDQLEERYRSRETWLQAALTALAAATEIASKKRLPIVLAIELFLREADEADTGHPRAIDELSDSFSWTPPSLTVYRRGSEPWKAKSDFVPIIVSSDQQSAIWKEALFQEWYDATEGNYDRRLWLVGY